MLPTSPFTRSDAFDSGIAQRQWRELTAGRHIRPLVRGVYADATLPDTIDLRVAAVARRLQPGQVVARTTAAWLYGVDVVDPRGLPATPHVEVVAMTRSGRPQTRGTIAHAADDLRADDVASINGIPLTSPLRTATDITRFGRRQEGLVVLDYFLREKSFTQEELLASLPRWARRRGILNLRELAPLASPLSESGAESRMRLEFVDGGLPQPELQIWVTDHLGVRRYRLDMGYRRFMIAMEYDGEEFHGPDRARHDSQRRHWIEGRGWHVLVFRREDVYGSPHAMVSTVQRSLLQVRAS